MSILERFSTIIKANINDLLARAENPAKMMDQYMRQLMSDLADVKRETASVMAEESRIQRQLEEKRQESAKNADLARRALQLSNEDDARVFLAKKQELEKRIEELQKMYDVAHENSMRMRQVHDKLVSDAETLRARMYAKKEEIVQNISEISKYEKEKIGKEIYQRGFVTIICGMIVLAGQLSAALIFAQNEVPGAGILCTSGMMCFTGLMIANGLYTISHAKKLYKSNSITNTTAQHATDT